MKELEKEWFKEDAVALAPKLLGKIMRYGECCGRIVEVEAYTTDDAAHSRTLTPRSRIIYETYGHWYVYFTYGMHYCANVTTNAGGAGAILIRALEPLEGIELMEKRRKTFDLHNLCSGPAKLCQALSITTAENGLPIQNDFTIYDAPEIPEQDIVSGPRIGIRQATELPWRFLIKDNSFVSRK